MDDRYVIQKMLDRYLNDTYRNLINERLSNIIKTSTIPFAVVSKNGLGFGFNFISHTAEFEYNRLRAELIEYEKTVYPNVVHAQ